MTYLYVRRNGCGWLYRATARKRDEAKRNRAWAAHERQAKPSSEMEPVRAESSLDSAGYSAQTENGKKLIPT